MMTHAQRDKINHQPERREGQGKTRLKWTKNKLRVADHATLRFEFSTNS